jgi:hypothetical protein
MSRLFDPVFRLGRGRGLPLHVAGRIGAAGPSRSWARVGLPGSSLLVRCSLVGHLLISAVRVLRFVRQSLQGVQPVGNHLKA